MNFARIESSVEVAMTQGAHVGSVGGAYGLLEDLVRSGVRRVTHVDFDRVGHANVPRQDFDHDDARVRRAKAAALARRIRAVNPDAVVSALERDFCSMNDNEIDEHFGDSDLLIAATDFHPAQARCNQVALRLGIPALFLGIYAKGRGGEVMAVDPSDPRGGCKRCMAPVRYEAFSTGGGDVSSDGGTIFDLHLIDAIAGQLALGLLTRGADNRFGRLIDQLQGRNLFIVKTDPEFRIGDRDVFTERLGSDTANFSFTTLALKRSRDPNCPDCAQFRGERAARRQGR